MFDQSQDGNQGAAPDSFLPWNRPDPNGMASSAMNPSPSSQGGNEQTLSSAGDWTAGLGSTFLQDGSNSLTSLPLNLRSGSQDHVSGGGSRVRRLMPQFENQDSDVRPLSPRASVGQTSDFSLGLSCSSQLRSLDSFSGLLGAMSRFDTSSEAGHNFSGVRYPIITAPTPTCSSFAFGILRDSQAVSSSPVGLSDLPSAVIQGFGYDQDGLDNQVAFQPVDSGANQQKPPLTAVDASEHPMREPWCSPALAHPGSGSSSHSVFSQVIMMGSEKKSTLRFEAEEQAQTQNLAIRTRPAHPFSEEAPTFSVSEDSETCSSAALMPGRRQAPAPLRLSTGTRPSREQVPARTWERYKLAIRMLYLDERKPLKEVMSIMEARFGFHATPKMYKTRFSQWGFVKNNTEEEIKRLLSIKLQRDAEGKVSEFVRNGRVVDLGTYLKRKGMTEYDLVDFALPAELPAHLKCRTPSPPLFLKSPDLLRAQELVIGNLRKVFVHCRQVEAEADVQVQWQSNMLWGAVSSEILLEANSFFEAGDADQGGGSLMRAFKQLEMDLKSITPQAIMELLLALVNRDPGMSTALCKYLAAYSTTNLERLHPLRQIFGCLYEILQKHGARTLSEVLAISICSIAEELEAIFGCCHPHVVQTWIDLALFHNQAHPDRLQKILSELRGLLEQLHRQGGATSKEAVSLLFTVVQLQYCSSPQSEATKQVVQDFWNLTRRMGRMHPIRDARPNVYCYQSFINAEPPTKRCKRRYSAGAAILEEILGVHLQAYFNGVLHIMEGAFDGTVFLKRYDCLDTNRRSGSS